MGDTTLILTPYRIAGAAGGRRPGEPCHHCGRNDFHREGCIVALALDRDARDNARELTAKAPRIAARFVAVGRTVMRGQEFIANAASGNMAQRIARALNVHKPNARGV